VSDDAHLIVDSDAGEVGRRVRGAVDAEQRAAGFVGDPDADADAIAEFTVGVLRAPPPTSPPTSPPST
jgi:hypothetical protein